MYAMRVITTSCKLGPIEGISGYQAPLFMCVTARFPRIGRQTAQVTLGHVVPCVRYQPLCRLGGMLAAVPHNRPNGPTEL